MNDVVQELRSKWGEVALVQRRGHEWRGVVLKSKAPVRMVAALREPDERKALLIEGPLSSAPPAPIRFDAQGLSLTDQRRPKENVFRIAIVLERPELLEIFETLCADLVFVISSAVEIPSAIASVTRRLQAWQACLRSRKTGLTAEEQVGLAGELTVLQIWSEESSYPSAIEAWRGPLGGLFDFIGEGLAVEVKSVLGVGSQLHISHFDQLDLAGLNALIVARVRFRLVRGGRTLPNIVQAVRGGIYTLSPGSLRDFEDKLLSAGYLENDRSLYNIGFDLDEEVYCYAVREDFPRISRRSLPPAIIDGSYEIEERAIVEWRQNSQYLRQAVKGNGGKR